MSQEKTIEELKLEISGYYVEELQKELGWLKGIVLRPIKEDIKNIIINNKELPNKFDEIEEFGRWKNIINFVVPSIAKQIFDFIKEKKEEIATKTTRDELIALKNEILGKLRDDGNNKEDQQNTNNGEQGENVNQQDVSQQNINGEQGGNIDKQNTSGEQKENVEDDKEKMKSSTVGIIVGGTGSATVAIAGKETIKVINQKEVKEMGEKLTGKQIRESVSAILESAENQKKALASTRQLSRAQSANIDNQIKNIRSLLTTDNFTDEGIEAFIAWQKLGDDMPAELLDEMGHNPRNINKLAKYKNEISKIDDLNELKTFLKDKGITDLDDAFLRVLIKNKQDVEGIIRLAGNASRAKNIAKAVKGALVVDVAFFGVDIRAFLETRKEAELIEKVNKVRAKNKYSQANTQLIIGAASVAFEILIACTCYGSASGPMGTVVGFLVGALSAAASIGADALYYDVRDFYLQNKEEFIKQKRSQISQAILQGLYNKKEGNTTINEFIGAPDAAQKIKCTNDAIWAAIFLDELEYGKYRGNKELFEYITSGKSLSEYEADIEKDKEKKEAFEKSRDGINEEIGKRMEYCATKESEVVKGIKECKGMKTLDDIIVHSRVYLHMSGNGKWNDNNDYQTNVQSYKEEFFKDVDQDKLNKLEALKSSNKEMFDEIIATTNEEIMLGSVDGENIAGDGNNESDSVQNDEKIPEYREDNKDAYLMLKSYVKLVTKYKEWLEITQSNEEKVKLDIPDKNKHTGYVEALFINDLKTDTLLIPSAEGDEGTIARFNEGHEREGILEVSDDPLYNVLYRVGKELYGYTGNNEKSEIMGFYGEGVGETHGFYFSSKWKINVDRSIDPGMVDTDLQGPFNSQDEVNKLVDKFILDNFYTLDPDTNQYKRKGAGIIDTKTENIDDQLQDEFEAKLKEVMQEELSYRIKNNIESVKNEIIKFVQDSYSGEEDEEVSYIALPYYLVIKAKRAGLGDLQKALFKWRSDKGKMEVCRLPYDTFNKALPFDDDKVIVSYISSYRKIRDEKSNVLEGDDVFTDEEKFFIDRVEKAHKLIEDLRSCESFWSKEDELDLPTEVEHLISDRYKERERFKRNLLVRNPGYISTKTIEQYNEFAEYFESLYRGLLRELTTFKSSNDADSYTYYASALSEGSKNHFDEKGHIKKDKELEFTKVQKVTEFYDEQLKVQKLKVGDKEMTIQELWDMEPPKEGSDMPKQEYEEIKALALQASNTILTVLLERSMLTKDSNGNVTNISIGGNMGDTDKEKAVNDDKAKQETKALIEERLKVLKIPPRNINKDQVQKNTRDQEIIELTEQEKKTILKSIDIQKIIENTLPEIERQGKRGDIIYDPEKDTISSWNNEVKIEAVEKEKGKYVFYINHIKEICFENVEDCLWMANFRNWVMYEYPKYEKTIQFAKDPDINRIGSDATFVRGNVTLIPREELNKKCSICKDDKNMELLTRWLNHEVLNDYQNALLPELKDGDVAQPHY